jgi:prefoldin subunit 5
MIVGTGFVALLTAAAAQRFLAAEIRADVGEAVDEVDLSDAHIAQELGQIRAQLERLTATMERRTDQR